jgi:hypothetical protein
MEYAAASGPPTPRKYTHVADVAARRNPAMMTPHAAKCGSPHTFSRDGYPAVYLRALVASSLARWN